MPAGVKTGQAVAPGGHLRIRTFAVALVVPSALSLTGPAAPTYAAAVCQGQPATIESADGSITSTEGNDVIVATNPKAGVEALGGNDVICVVGGAAEVERNCER